MKNIRSHKQFAVLGLAAACATVLMWPRQDTQPPAVGAVANALAGTANASGSLPGPGLRPTAYAAPTPRNDAQTKLGSGQLLQAVQLLSQARAANPASPAGAGNARSGGAVRSAVTAAAQIAALDRAGIPMRLRDGEKVRVNINLMMTYDEVQNPSLLDRATSTLRETLLSAGLQATRINGSPSLEASIPLARLEWVASLKPVAQISLMNMSRPAVFSDGATASNIDRLRSLGRYGQLATNLRKDLNGEGLTIAIVDHFTDRNDAIWKLQDAAEWPKNTAAQTDKLTLTASFDGAFGYRGPREGGNHGNAVTEIVYDIAPAAKFRLYDNAGAADWVAAIQDAANLNDRNVAQGEPRAQVITASVGFNLGAPGDGTGTGSGLKGLYDAIEAAKNNGVIVLNAAGNEAQMHWDGDSTAGAGANVLQDFVVGNTNANGAAIIDSVNPLTIEGRYGGCIPVGPKHMDDHLAEFDVSLGWNDWTSADNTTNADYKLELVHWADAVKRKGRVVTPAGWVAVAQSDYAQTGGGGQQPLEHISYAPTAASKTAACDAVGFDPEHYAGGGKFGVRITRKTVRASNFLRLISSGYEFQYAQADRSLIHPADSASVITVAALDAATSNLESYSSRGPVLAAGGARPAGQAVGNAKPDLANFANVDTVSYGDNVFSGTSSATPHAAALALLGLQHQRQLTHATVPASLPATATAQQKAERGALLKQRNVDLSDSVYESLVYVSSTGGNDLGPVGFDGSYGHGRLKFHVNSEACFLSATYDPKYRSLLPEQAAPLPAGQKSYDQLRTDNSAACARK